MEEHKIPPTADIELELLLEAIFRRYKYDFRLYSRASLRRRSQAALSHFRLPTLTRLQENVLHQEGFFIELLQFLTIPVTELFRDPPYFHRIREQVIPHLRTYPSLKLWIAGCSTGEEAYSWAILLEEEGLLGRTILYATDINPISLKRAESGIYRSADIAKFTQNYESAGGKAALADFYTEAYGAIKFSPRLKKQILFTDHSLATDSVFSEVQLISCRNVLIYFEPPLQDRAVRLFRDSLVVGGFLGIGEKESLRFSPLASSFESWAQESRIYRKSATKTCEPYLSKKAAS
jgi:chemotaxis protein methyltransferase CheR